MSARTRDMIANEIARVLRYGSPTANLRELLKAYDMDDLHIAFDYVPPVPKDYRDVVIEAVERLRQIRLEDQFEDLKKEIKKPTWFDIWTFRFVLGGIIVAFLAWWYPRSPADSNNTPTYPLPATVAPPTAPTAPTSPSNPPPAASIQSDEGPAKPFPPPTAPQTNSVVAPASPKK